MAEDWEERIRAIAGALLTLEINTIEKPNMSASKMPSVPMALHELVLLYEGELSGRDFHVTDELLAASKVRLDATGDALKAATKRLESWWGPGGDLPTRPDQDKDQDRKSGNLTNGPVTFEALVDILQTLEKYWFEIVELPPQKE